MGKTKTQQEAEEHIHPDLQEIRNRSRLHKLFNNEPHVYTWLTQDYTRKDIKKAIQTLKNNKAHGSDGIPGEAYKVLKQHLVTPITLIMNKIKNGQKMPTDWAEGVIVHIYNNKGEVDECSSYRPICLTQVIYKIWSQLIAKKLSKILHTLTKKQQYGYKTHLSTSGAIIKLESYLEKETKNTHIILTGLTKAFGKVNRTLLWTTLYKKGLPWEMITHIRSGHQNTTLRPKIKNKYGNATQNNVGVFQWSAISALLFIIYQDDMMEDYESLNQEAHIPVKHATERTNKEIDQYVSNEIRTEFEKRGKKKRKFIKQLHHGRYKFQNTPRTAEELKTHYTRPTPELQGNTTLQSTDHREFAGDTILYLEPKSNQDILTHLNHYQIVTKGREIPIQ